MVLGSPEIRELDGPFPGDVCDTANDHADVRWATVRMFRAGTQYLAELEALDAEGDWETDRSGVERHQLVHLHRLDKATTLRNREEPQ
jgi:hypothetical protein